MELNIIEGQIKRPLKVVIYGSEGIGKTTVAAHSIEPLFIDTDSDYDVQSGQKLRKLFCQVGVAFAVAEFLNAGFRVLLANMIHAHLLCPIGGI